MEIERLFSLHLASLCRGAGHRLQRRAQTPVEFTLETTATGTRLRVVESSFDKLPPHRRNIAFRTNEGGWEIQMQNIARYLGDHA